MNNIHERKEELENYFLILAAFEDNLAQYKKIKNQLVEVSYHLHGLFNMCSIVMIIRVKRVLTDVTVIDMQQ